MGTIKLLVGIAIIIASFVYIIRNKSCMLDNLMKKTKEEFQRGCGQNIYIIENRRN